MDGALTKDEIVQLLRGVDSDYSGNDVKDAAGPFILTPEEIELLLKAINDDKIDTHPADTRERVTVRSSTSTESNDYVSLTTNQLTVNQYVHVIDRTGALKALQELKDIVLKNKLTE